MNKVETAGVYRALYVKQRLLRSSRAATGQAQTLKEQAVTKRMFELRKALK